MRASNRFSNAANGFGLQGSTYILNRRKRHRGCGSGSFNVLPNDIFQDTT